MEAKKIIDTTLIGEWKDVTDLELSSITKNADDNEKLNGLVLRGYEMKFKDTANTNREVYAPDCFDDFIKEYFVANKLNIPVTLCHGYRFDDLCGRVIYCEVNKTGFYFVAYIPRTLARFEQIKTAIKEGLLQGFSKEGWATDYDYKYDEDGYWTHDYIKKMNITCVSLVATPANAMSFEKAQETKDSTMFKGLKDTTKTAKKDGGIISRMFN